ncbi:hypothetical protein UFOVP453_23 [uncultured Caudovirales phage]|uniref:Uncharacterized protein n=1 Tax=uncultured Caudovirales phage TaxID=2100421 RepID=A0A6J5MGH7_9CAUD|nr:hypothetical protein UFOVP453_23 [uncultured Caudovirales phage]
MLKKTCAACGKDRKRTKLVYDNKFRPYCSRAHECNESNPNSVTNLIKNGKMTQLLTHDDAVKLFAEHNNGNMIRLLDSPITIRLTDVHQAQFIEDSCKRLNMTTSEFIRSLIEKASQSSNADVTPEIPATPATPAVDDDLTF